MNVSSFVYGHSLIIRRIGGREKRQCVRHGHLSPRILTDLSMCILFNSVKQVMSRITFEKVNAWSRIFFYTVNERASFALHARSFESPKLIVRAYN